MGSAEASESLPRQAALWPQSAIIERRSIAVTFAFVVALLLVCALVASVYCRGLYQDGAYYLYRVAEREWFYLFDPARTTVQVLRQAPVVLLSKIGDFSLVARGQVFSFAMLALPAMLVALCWFIAPRERKAWTLFPALHLLVGFGTTSFEAVGEAAIAASYFWILLFLLLFRTRRALSQLMFLLLCLPAFRLHEGAFLLTPVLLLACALRWRAAENAQERSFLVLSAVLIAAIFVYELRWIVHPRIAGERESALRGMYTLGFLYFEGRVNLPVVTALTALAALAGVTAVRRNAQADLGNARARAVAAAFVLFALASIAMAWEVDRSFAPRSQALARYDPIYASIVLGIAAVLTATARLSTAAWISAPALVIVAALAVAQAGADLAATARWRAYIADFQSRLTNSAGLIAWSSTTRTGDPVRDTDWELMTSDWVLPIMSIIFAKDGVVRAIFDYPEATSFRPIDPKDPQTLSRLRGVDYEPYKQLLSGTALSPKAMR